MDNILLGALGVLLFFTYKNNKQVVENFLNVPLQARLEQVAVYPSGKQQAIPQSQMYMVPSSYQATVPPRQASVGYGPHIRYNPPSGALRGESMGSLAGRTVITEGYGKDALPSYSNGVVSQQEVPVAEEQGGFEGGINELGKTEPQPIIIDRMIYSTTNTISTREGCPIRGDLPIAPTNQEGWFKTPGTPASHLRTGALAAIGGINNDTTKELLALKSASKGVTHAADSINYTVQKSSFMSGGGGDVSVKVTSFP